MNVLQTVRFLKNEPSGNVKKTFLNYVSRMFAYVILGMFLHRRTENCLPGRSSQADPEPFFSTCFRLGTFTTNTNYRRAINFLTG